MTAYDYSGIQATATRLIARFGRSAILAKKTPGLGYNPGDPMETDYEVTLVADDYRQRERDGTLVQANDRRYYMTSSVAPESQDMIVDGDEQLTIVNVMELKPGPSTVMYTLQVRHG